MLKSLPTVVIDITDHTIPASEALFMHAALSQQQRLSFMPPLFAHTEKSSAVIKQLVFRNQKRHDGTPRR